MSSPQQEFVPYVAARRRFSGAQKLALLALAAVGLTALLHDPLLIMRALVAVHLLYATGFLILRIMTVALDLSDNALPQETQADPASASFSLLCPLYKEAESLPNLLRSLDRLRYPAGRLEVLLLIEEDDEATLKAAERLPRRTRVIRIPAGGPRTKPNALNAGLLEAKGEIVGIYDAEDRPEPDQLLKVAATFGEAGGRVACVQARLNYYNRDDGFITRMFALEYSLHFDWFLPGMARLGLPLPLGGTSNFVRRDALVAVGGWDPYNVTEDADLGLRLARAGYLMRTVDSTTFEEATDTPARWVRQRSRWIKGFLQTGFVHLRGPMGPGAFVTLHLAILAVVVSALVNPLSWGIFLGWALTGTMIFAPVFEGAFGPLCLLLFAGGSAAHIWLFMLAPLKRGWFDLSTAALFLPFYWVLQSVAGYKALFGFLLKPHYWEKTEHSPGENTALEEAL